MPIYEYPIATAKFGIKTAFDVEIFRHAIAEAYRIKSFMHCNGFAVMAMNDKEHNQAVNAPLRFIDDLCRMLRLVETEQKEIEQQERNFTDHKWLLFSEVYRENPEPTQFTDSKFSGPLMQFTNMTPLAYAYGKFGPAFRVALFKFLDKGCFFEIELEHAVIYSS